MVGIYISYLIILACVDVPSQSEIGYFNKEIMSDKAITGS